MKNVRFVVVLFALMLLAAACGGESAEEALLEQILESSGEDIGDIDINTDDGEFSMTVEGEDGEDISISSSGDDEDFSITVEGDDGGTFSFGSGEIPEGMQLPVVDGGAVASSFTTDDAKTVSISYPSTEFDQLVSFYDSQLDADSDEVSRFESSYATDDGNFRSVSWTAEDGSWNVGVADCYGVSSGELDSACVTLSEFAS